MVESGKRGRGRPVTYDKAMIDGILERMSAGETLRAICREPGYPDATLIRYWAIKDDPPGFAQQYARARELQASAFFEEAVEESKREKCDAQLLRIRIDTLKWAAAKMYPRLYGDKVQTELSGSVNLPAITVTLAK